jgi:hypothetical protein
MCGDGDPHPPGWATAGVGVPHGISDQLGDEQQRVIDLRMIDSLQQPSQTPPRTRHGSDVGGDVELPQQTESLHRVSLRT